MPLTELWTPMSFHKELHSQRVRTHKPSSGSSSGFQHQMALVFCRPQKELLESLALSLECFPVFQYRLPFTVSSCCQLISTTIQRQGMFYMLHLAQSVSLHMHPYHRKRTRNDKISSLDIKLFAGI